MGYRSGDTELLAAFLLEVESGYPARMVFSAIIEVKLYVELVFVEGVDFVLLDVDIAVVFILPKGDEVTGLTNLEPIVFAESLGIVDIVAHMIFVVIINYDNIVILE